MANPATSGWVILLNKSPRGPFSEGEVLNLIEQKLVRPNDMGLLISGTSKSNWNLLKTYPEFKGAFEGQGSSVPLSGIPTPTAEEGSYNRKPTPAPELSELPDIKPEDLIPRTTRNVFENRLDEAAVEAMQELPSLRRDSPFGLLKRLSPLLGLFLLFFVGFEIFRPKTEAPEASLEKQVEIGSIGAMDPPKAQARTAASLPRQQSAKRAVEETTPESSLPAPPPPSDPAPPLDDRAREEKTSELADRGSRKDDDDRYSEDDSDEEVRLRKKAKKRLKKVVEDDEFDRASDRSSDRSADKSTDKSTDKSADKSDRQESGASDDSERGL